MQIDYTRLPEHLRDGARRYIEDGVKPGSFLTAMICDDGERARALADEINRAVLPEITAFWSLEAPMMCRGSKPIMDRWMRLGGIEGQRPRFGIATARREATT